MNLKPKLFAAWLLAILTSSCAAETAKPNILLIFADDIGYRTSATGKWQLATIQHLFQIHRESGRSLPSQANW